MVLDYNKVSSTVGPTTATVLYSVTPIGGQGGEERAAVCPGAAARHG